MSVLGLAALPTEHLHAAAIRDGHQAEIVHRHFEPHHAVAPHAAWTWITRMVITTSSG
jgi:hypothetical protein